MKHAVELFFRIALLTFTWSVWLWVLNQPFSNIMNLSIIVGGVLLVFPIVWLGRMILDRQPTTSRAAWITTFVHYAVGILFGAAIIRAVTTHQDWPGGMLPIPVEIGLLLVIITGIAALSTMVNLALKGLGAPFAIALSKKLAVDWLYAWTRNPMVLAVLAFLLSLGIWFQSALFVLWVLVLFAPALLFFVKVYEERELELTLRGILSGVQIQNANVVPKKTRGLNGASPYKRLQPAASLSALAARRLTRNPLQKEGDSYAYPAQLALVKVFHRLELGWQRQLKPYRQPSCAIMHSLWAANHNLALFKVHIFNPQA